MADKWIKSKVFSNGGREGREGKRKGCRPGGRGGEPQGRGEGGRELGANPHSISLLKSLACGLMRRSKGPHCPGLPAACLAG